MIVARQFIAWNGLNKRSVPQGTVLVGLLAVHRSTDRTFRPTQSHLALRDGPSLDTFQAVNCLATFI